MRQGPVLEFDEILIEIYNQVVGPLSKLVIDFKEVTSKPRAPEKIMERSGGPNKAIIVLVSTKYFLAIVS